MKKRSSASGLESDSRHGVSLGSIQLLLYVVLCSLVSQSNAEHNCIHHKVMRDAKDIPVEPGIVHDYTILSYDHTERAPLPGSPIRMVIDTTYLSEDMDPDYICTNVGDWKRNGLFATGSASNPTPPCQSLDDFNCWFQCTEDDLLTDEKLEFLVNRIVPDITNFWKSAINVNPVVGPLKFSQPTCGCYGSPGASIPSQYSTTGSGVNADMVIFLTARTTRYTENTIAFACPCINDLATRRPVAGYINWGPNRISLDNVSYPEQLGVGTHEITHALGFTSGMYGYYNDPTGKAAVTTTVSYNAPNLPTHNVTLITTPNVVAIARQHFNCPSLIGVELENGGSSGTAASHWERRLLLNEYMTGYSSYDPRRSAFTLALLQDTGWYFPNYTIADSLAWGQNMGCSFVTERCTSATRSSPYIAATPNDEGCTWDGLRKGRSNVVEYTEDLDLWYQYYSDPEEGGRDDLADYCSYLEYSAEWRGDCLISDFNAPGDDYYLIENYGEVYGPNSRCISAKDGKGAVGGSCHSFTCVNGKLKMKIQYSWYDCPSNGFEISVSNEFGDLMGVYKCPSDVQAVCSASPQDNVVWPSFTSVSPTKAEVNGEVTVTGSNFGTNPKVLFGDYYGCVDSTMVISGNTITCNIGARNFVPRLRKPVSVDVIIQDEAGRTATGARALTLSSSNLAAPSFSLALFLYIVTYLVN